MSCSRCQADLQPNDFGNPRGCAFDDAGVFTVGNWNCATIEALLEHAQEVDGADESMQIIRSAHKEPDDYYHNGWVVLTRYKHRGKTSSAIHVGDFWPPKPLTLALAESILKARGSL